MKPTVTNSIKRSSLLSFVMITVVFIASMYGPKSIVENTADPRYNDSVCYQRFYCKIEVAVIKKLDMDPF